MSPSRRAARASHLGLPVPARPSRRSRPAAPARRFTADVLCWLALWAVCLLPVWPLYRDPALFVTAGGGLLAALALGVPAARFRLPWHLLLACAVVLYLLIGVQLAVPGAAVAHVLPGWDGLSQLVRGSVTSWVDVLSVDPPLADFGAVLVPVLILTLGGGLAGWLALWHGKRVLAALAPAALAVYGVLFGARTGFHPVAMGAVVLAVVGVWVLALGPRARGIDAEHTRALAAGARRRAAVGAVLLAVCALAGAGLSGALAPQHRSVLRTAYEPSYQPLRHVSPLQQYRAWVTGDAAGSTVARVSGLPRGSMLRVAVLDHYNGLAMQVGDSASSGSFTLLPSDVTTPGQDPVSVQVTWLRPYGEWVPVPEHLERITLPSAQRQGLYYDRALGAAVAPGALPAGTEYSTLSAPAAAPLRSGLSGLTPGTAVQPDLTQLPESLVAADAAQAPAEATPGAKLEASLRLLLDGYVSHGEDDEAPSRSGHSVERLDRLATRDPMVGDAEQYAAAFALLARQDGFPSRVVLGFVDANGDGKLSGSELTAWVQVQDATRGWVSIDPNPRPRPVPKHSSTTEHAVSLPRTVLPPDPPVQKDPTPPRADESTQPPSPQPAAWLVALTIAWWWMWRVGAVLAVLTAPWWLLLLLRGVRRALRRRADRQHGRVSGGWAELRDDLAGDGVPVAAAATRSEVAAHAGSAEVTALATRADALSFAPDGIGPDEVRAYWEDVATARTRLRKAGTRRERWGRRLAPRALARRWHLWRAR